MKIAIVCDWLVTFAGAERVLAEMIQCFPEADVFAIIDFLPEEQRGFLRNKPVTTTYIQKFPFAKKLYRSYLPFMPMAIEQLDLSAYDVILSSSHAIAKGVITGPDQIHISYVHSPMRYAWDMQAAYLRDAGLNNNIKGLFAKFLLHKLRLWDLRTVNGVDHFIANSKFIARRIHKTYRREADVIYPPVDTHTFTPHHDKENYYLTASRLVPYKKIDLIVESFASMPDKKLVVIGDGPEFDKIKAKATANVEMRGYQSTDKLIHAMQRAKAFVFAAEEDFGIMPLEAQACGTPVIAYGKGGALESVRGLEQKNPTGLFFKEQSVTSIQDAVKAFEANQGQFTVENCVKQAALFNPERFQKQLKQWIEEKIYENRS